jgi:dephospho-CoA kinase
MTNNKKVIIGLVGDLAAGKSTFSNYLIKNYNAQTYRFSNILRDILNRLYVEKNRENLQNISTVIRAQFGQDVLSKVIAEDVKNDPHDLIVVDGVRRPSDITYLQELPNFHLLYLTADPKLRWERLVKRNENPGDDKKSFDEFLHDENAEADRLIKELGKTAENIITNNLEMDLFYSEIEKSLSKIGYATKN